MANLNKVMIIGNLTRDPETKTMTSGTVLTTMRLATNRTYTTTEGVKKDEATYVDVDVWGKPAEIISKYMKKGRSIFVEGRLKLDEWVDKETGKNRSAHRIVCENFQFIDSKREGGNVQSEEGTVSVESDEAAMEETMGQMFPKSERDPAITEALKKFGKTVKK